MKLIFAVDAIFPPLTGIGRYAWELAVGLAQRPQQPGDSVRFYLHGRFVSNPALDGMPGVADVSQTQGDRPVLPVAARLRARLARMPLAVRAYSLLMPQVHRLRLRGWRDHVFFSPNYFLPPVSGPALATVHDLSTLLYPQFHPSARVALMDRELPRTLARAQLLLTDSEFVRQELIAHCGVAPERVCAIPLGVDAGFAPRTPEQTRAVLARHGLTHGGYVLCVATLEPRKNIDRLLDGYFMLPPALRTRFPLVLVGSEGWRSADLHARVAALADQGVRYLRYVPEAELHTLYAGAALFALVSLYEGFGLPVIEAMASGVPVLTSNAASLPEVAGDMALQVAPQNVDAIAAGLRRGLEDDAWRTAARHGGPARAAQFRWDACVRRTLAQVAALQAGASA
ncbi:MAG: hypothetical protein OHK0048_24760 [Rhodoferax sp.]